MKQRLIAYLLLLPIALLGLSMLMWARSYLPEHCYCRLLHGRLLLLFVSGSYAAYLEPTNSKCVGVEVVISEITETDRTAVNWKWAGFELVIPSGRVIPSGAIIGIPFLAIVPVLAALSVWSWHAYRRYSLRLLPGHCTHCGYDLRASTGRCSECGTAIPAGTQADSSVGG